MEIYVLDPTLGWVPKICDKRGDTFTVTGTQTIKIGFHDIYKIRNMPKKTCFQKEVR